MRDIQITKECIEFLEGQGARVIDKFFQLVEVMMEVKVVNKNFVKKLQCTEFCELRIKAGNEYRVILFSINHENFVEASEIICLDAFFKEKHQGL